jgi:hypothetical protein
MEYPFYSHNYQHLYAYNSPGTQTSSPNPTTSISAVDLSGAKETVTLSVKVVNPSKKNDTKLFILRDVDTHQLDKPERLQKLFTEQLQGEVSSQPNFEFGYYKGNARVHVRSVEDCKELAKNVVKSKSMLWCMGTDNSSK